MTVDDKLKAIDMGDVAFFAFVQQHMEDFRTLEDALKEYKRLKG